MADTIDLPNGKKLTVDDLMAKAQKEVSEEMVKEQVEKLKRKLREKSKANELVAGLTREIEALKLEIADVLGN